MKLALCAIALVAMVGNAGAVEKKPKPKAQPKQNVTKIAPHVEVAFSPDQGSDTEALAIQAISAARASISLASYHLTSQPVADALCAAAARGVAVTVLLDEKDNHKGAKESQRGHLDSCNVAVRTNASYPVMNDKFAVIDGMTVETGSYNFGSGLALKNAENALVVWNDKALADKYQAKFNQLFDEGSPK